MFCSKQYKNHRTNMSSESDYSIVSSDGTYQTMFDALSKIHDIVSEQNELALPRICVIGDQSSGKSSLLSRGIVRQI